MVRLNDSFFEQITATVNKLVKWKEEKDRTYCTQEEKDLMLDDKGPWYKHYTMEMKKDKARDRNFFIFKDAHVVRVFFKPITADKDKYDKETNELIHKKGDTINKPSNKNKAGEEYKNGNYRLWGNIFPLKGNTSQIIWISEALIKKGAEDKIIQFRKSALLRGFIGTQYKPMDDSYKGYSLDYKDFLKYMNAKTLDEIHKALYYENYTLWVWEIIGGL